jgi:hypothetical protein
LVIELLHTPNNVLRFFLAKPLNLWGKWSNSRSVHLMAWALHDFASPQSKLRDDATCLLLFPLELQPSFESQTQKLFTGDFEAQTTKPSGEVYPLHLLHDLDTCHSHPRPPDHQVLLRLCLTWSTILLTWSTRSTPPHVLLLVDVPKCVSYQRAVFRSSWSLGPSLASVLHRSQSIGTTRLYLTLSMSVDRLCVPHLHTNTTKKHACCTHTHTMVSL